MRSHMQPEASSISERFALAKDALQLVDRFVQLGMLVELLLIGAEVVAFAAP